MITCKEIEEKKFIYGVEENEGIVYDLYINDFGYNDTKLYMYLNLIFPDGHQENIQIYNPENSIFHEDQFEKEPEKLKSYDSKTGNWLDKNYYMMFDRDILIEYYIDKLNKEIESNEFKIEECNVNIEKNKKLVKLLKAQKYDKF